VGDAMVKIVQDETELTVYPVEKIDRSGGGPRFDFFEPLSGKKIAIYKGTEYEIFRMNLSLTASEMVTLRGMFKAGRMCQLVIDNAESYNVVITECTVEDYDETKEIPVVLEEVSQVIDDSN